MPALVGAFFLPATTIGCSSAGSSSLETYGYAYANPLNGGMIYAVPRGGGAPLLLAAGQRADNLGSVFTFDGSNAYYSDEVYTPDAGSSYVTSLVSIPLSGGTPLTIASGLGDFVTALAVDAKNVYFIDTMTPVDPATQTAVSSIDKVPLAGGAVETVVSGEPQPYTLAVAGGFLYWGDSNSDIRRMSTNGGAIETLATNQEAIRAIAVDATGVYWVNNGQLSIDCGSSGGSIVALRSGSAQPTTLVGDLANAGSIAVFQGAVYFSFAAPVGCQFGAGSDGEVARTAPGETATLASALSEPSNLFADSTAFYYTTVAFGDAGDYIYEPHAIQTRPSF